MNTEKKLEDMLIVTRWPDHSDIPTKGEGIDTINWLIKLITEIRSVKSKLNVPAGMKIPIVVASATEKAKNRFKETELMLKGTGRIAEISYAETPVQNSIQIATDGAIVCLPLADIVDLQKELKRLEKNLTKANKEIDGLQARLANEGFRNNAPPETIAETEAKLTKAQEDADTAKEFMDKLNNALKT